MHIGHTHPIQYYTEERGQLRQLQTITEEKDLEIFVTYDLKSSRECAQASQKAMSVLGMIRRNFRRITVQDFKILYKSYIWTHLEYCPSVVTIPSSWHHNTGTGPATSNETSTGVAKCTLWRRFEETWAVLVRKTTHERRFNWDVQDSYRQRRYWLQTVLHLSSIYHDTRKHSLRLYVARSNLWMDSAVFNACYSL